jgi:hypothetical protein
MYLKEGEEKEILKLNEAKEKEFYRKKDEEISELRSQKLNLILLLLTIAQVWTGLYTSSPLASLEYGWIFNLFGYIILGVYGIYRYNIYNKKESKKMGEPFKL